MRVADVRLAAEEENPGRPSHDFLLKPQDILPYIAYITLKEWFGKPQGSFDETKSQWCYELKIPGAFLEIYDWKMSTWSIAVYADSHEECTAREIADQFLDLFRKQAAQHNIKIKAAIAKPKGFVLQNPFTLYYASAKNILSDLREPDVDVDEERNIGGSPLRQDPDLCKSTFFLFIAALEGLTNLIYELYLKPDLRDERIYERLSREQIDLKVRLAPAYCECFKNELIDSESEVFRKFHSIVNLRNDFVHANFTKTMRHPIIEEEDYRFLIDVSTKDKTGLPKNIGDMTTEHLLIIEQSMDDMIRLLTDKMKPRYRREFESVLHEEYIQVELQDGEVVVVT